MSSDSGEREIEMLKERVELLESLLIELAQECAPLCGGEWIAIASIRIRQANEE
jgi:hypothetical protein